MNFEWEDEFDSLVDAFIERHFGKPQGITHLFPCMRNEYRWAGHRPQVLDSRITAKNNTEYHGLETHATQYHVTAQYEFAYHFWLIAAYWRRQDAKANLFDDPNHQEAVRFCIKQALYNQALHEWQQMGRAKPPQPEDFGLRSATLARQDNDALQQIETVIGKARNS